uniref:Uncharacterized protein n=1 Tax=Steinernema glaseri TaxID=37863 RepID=A0A1I7ZKY1_9BILA
MFDFCALERRRSRRHLHKRGVRQSLRLRDCGTEGSEAVRWEAPPGAGLRLLFEEKMIPICYCAYDTPGGGFLRRSDPAADPPDRSRVCSVPRIFHIDCHGLARHKQPSLDSHHEPQTPPVRRSRLPLQMARQGLPEGDQCGHR